MPTAPPRADILRGVIPPLVTPLTLEGELDTPGLERLVAHLLGAGVDGLFALGSSGEVAFFDDTMRERVLDVVVGLVGGQVPVLAGIIDMQTSRVLTHLRTAERLGADGVVATAPFYAITGPDEIEGHFRTIAARSSVPVYAYDLPVSVHTKLDPRLLVRLGSDGVLAGVKDSSGDDVSFRRLVMMNREAGRPLSVLTGHEVVVDGAYLAGADGCVPGLGNVDPAGYVRMHRAVREGDWKTVQHEQDRLAALFEIVFAARGKVGPAAGVGAFKTALRLLGILDTNAMSVPMAALDADDAQAVRPILERAGLL